MENLAKKREYSDRELLLGSEQQFCQLIDRYSTKLSRFLARYAVALSEREDMTQEVIIKTYRAKNSFKAKETFASWFFAIALNTVRDQCRKNWREDKIFSKNDKFSEGIEKDTAETQLLNKEKKENIEKLVNSLEKNYRETIWLHYAADLSLKEIAKIMHKPESTINNWLHRGRQKLKEDINEA